jgi:hypothetical protein
MNDTQDIDSIIQALYETICGPTGQERQWDRLRNLFFPGAHMIRTVVDNQGSPQAAVMDIETYITATVPYFQNQGFFEWEVARRTDRFGNIAQLFSTYEARYDPHDPAPFKRGINSIQLFHDGKRWWIMNMLWDNEREDNPLLEKYLVKELA